jgi:hypothetical protein
MIALPAVKRRNIKLKERTFMSGQTNILFVGSKYPTIELTYILLRGIWESAQVSPHSEQSESEDRSCAEGNIQVSSNNHYVCWLKYP